MANAPVSLEVCVDTIAGVHAALDGGAHRVELCAALSEDGLTPSAGLMVEAGHLPIPCYAMIRPRDGNFIFDTDDLAIMRRDICQARTAGLAGIVVGASDHAGALDIEVLRILVADARDMGVTLHRAIDTVSDPLDAVDAAVALGIERILTSGGANRAEDGIDVIAAMAKRAAGQLSVMAGSGVTPQNAAKIIEATGIREIHASCATEIEAGRPPALGTNAGRRATDPAKVRKLVEVICAL